jgi:hypothetical protein
VVAKVHNDIRAVVEEGFSSPIEMLEPDTGTYLGVRDNGYTPARRTGGRQAGFTHGGIFH